jgi:hypothetical protein
VRQMPYEPIEYDACTGSVFCGHCGACYQVGRNMLFSFLVRHRRAPSVQLFIAGQQQAANNGSNRKKQRDKEIK